MRSVMEIWRTLRSLRKRDELEAGLRDEIRFHIDQQTEKNIRAGLAPHEARRRALITFGGAESSTERVRDEIRTPVVETLVRDLQYAVRALRKNPGFTAVATMTLALAVGATASIFTVVQHVVLNPLPYPDSDRVITLDHSVPRQNVPRFTSMPPGLYFHYADRARTLAALALYRPSEMTITGHGVPERLPIGYTTPSLASVLRVAPARGRWFTSTEAEPGAPRVALLSHGVWQRRYGGDPNIVGKFITLGGVATQVVGIMPPSFAFPHSAVRVEVWLPDQLSRAAGFGIFTHFGVARLRDGVTVDDARAELTRLIGDVPQVYPGEPFAVGLVTTGGLTSVAITLKEATIGSVTRVLWILLASVGLVLLIACVNVGNLFMVRSEARQRELAVRRALGAARIRIAGQLLTESTLLAVVGGMIGLAVAWAGVRLLVTFGPPSLPRLDEVRLDPVGAAFTLALSTVAGLVFGALPLLHRVSFAAMLHDGGRGNTASRSRHRTRRLLMGGQVALALVLLLASGLMVRSFQNLLAVDPGFDSASALTFRVGLPQTEYTSRDAAATAHQTMLDRMKEIPGVIAVSASTCLPLAGGCMGNTMRAEGRVEPPGTIPPIVSFRAVAGGYVETMGMRLLRGRAIDRRDVEQRAPVVVINSALASAYFPHEDPVGRRVSFGRSDAWLTVVGLVANTTTRALNESTPAPKLFMPMSIAGGPGMPPTDLVSTGPDISVMTYVVRSITPPLSLVPSVRRAIDTIDAKLALADVKTLGDVLDRASAQMAFTMVLLAIAASVSLVLGLVGIYGVMSYIVTQRTGEIGVRLALGATPGSVATEVVRQCALVAVIGVLVGVTGGVAGSRFIESLLFQVSPRDPKVFVATALTLIVVTIVACWLPARRAARISPLEALRFE